MYKKITISTIIAIIICAAMYPPATQAATRKTICDVSLTSTSHEEIKCSLTSLKPTISGTDTDSKKVKISIYKTGETKTFVSKSVNVKNKKWKLKFAKKFPEGTYEIKISSQDSLGQTSTLSGTMYVGKATAHQVKVLSTLAISPIPLLSGGVVRAGTSVPVSYLQVSNIGQETLLLNSFNLKQNGSAASESVIGLTLIDETDTQRGSVGGVEGFSPFKNNTAVLPANMSFAPGQMRLFTIKATVSSNTNPHVGKHLMLVVDSINTNGFVSGLFPIHGTTWLISN
jgi:hypothetical protein